MLNDEDWVVGSVVTRPITRKLRANGVGHALGFKPWFAAKDTMAGGEDSMRIFRMEKMPRHIHFRENELWQGTITRYGIPPSGSELASGKVKVLIYLDDLKRVDRIRNIRYDPIEKVFIREYVSGRAEMGIEKFKGESRKMTYRSEAGIIKVVEILVDGDVVDYMDFTITEELTYLLAREDFDARRFSGEELKGVLAEIPLVPEALIKYIQREAP